jgi:hypothetical protein
MSGIRIHRSFVFVLLVGVAGVSLYFAYRFARQDYRVTDLGPAGHSDKILLNDQGEVVVGRKPEGDEAGFRLTFFNKDQESEAPAIPTQLDDIADFNTQRVLAGSTMVPGLENPDWRFPRACIWSTTDGLTELGLEGELRSWAHHIDEQGRVLILSETGFGETTLAVWESGACTLLGSPEEYWKVEANRKEWGVEYPQDWMRTFPQGMPPYLSMRSEGGTFFALGTNGHEVVGGSLLPVTFREKVSEWFTKSPSNPVHQVGLFLMKIKVLQDQRTKKYPFLWRKGQILDLNRKIPAASGWERLQRAIGINRGGQIVGVGVQKGGSHFFLLTPED